MNMRFSLIAALFFSPAVLAVDWSIGAGSKPLEMRNSVVQTKSIYCQNLIEKSDTDKEADYNALVTAAAMGKDNVVASILKTCANPNWRPPYSQSPPFFHANTPEVMQVFLNGGANLSSLDSRNRNVLFHQMVMTENDPERFSSFWETSDKDESTAGVLKHEKKLESLAKWGLEGKVWAIEKEQVLEIRRMIIKRVEAPYLLQKEMNGYSIIDAASYSGDVGNLEVILSKIGQNGKALLNPVGKQYPPLMRSLFNSCYLKKEDAKKSREEVASILMKNGANPLTKIYVPQVKSDVSYADHAVWLLDGETALWSNIENAISPTEWVMAWKTGSKLKIGSNGISNIFKIVAIPPLQKSCQN